MIDVPKQIEYWATSSDEDFAAAHLAIEKMLKAHVTRQTKDVPPHIHNLIRLSEMAGLSLDPEQADFLRRFDAERVILFGSYAQGTPSTDSDIDLLVVADTPLSPPERYCAVRRLLADVPCSFDIIVRTPDEYARWQSVVNNIVYFADKYGKVLYERTES